MKRRIGVVFVTSFILLLILGSPCYALWNSDVKKAKEFMQVGMYSQAIDLLNKRINEKPTDVEAHFQLGICYLTTRNYHGADQRFSSAMMLEADYGNKIGGEYKKAGSSELNKGRVNQAKTLFAKAVDYEPSLRKEIAQECFLAGKSHLDQGQSNSADELFSIVKAYDPALEDKIKDAEVAYAKRLLQIAKDKPKNERRRYINEAKKYLDQGTIDAVFPPPSWKTVSGSKKTFRGKVKDGAYVPLAIARFGTEIKVGYKMVLYTEDNKEFYVGAEGKFVKKTGRWEFVNQYPGKGELLEASAGEGTVLHWELQELR